MRTEAEARSRGGFELYAWFFMRISGLLLVFLALGHVTIMHILNDVSKIDYNFVATRWVSPFWRLYDLLLLFLALLHGANGMRVIIDDYARHRGWRVFWLSTLYTVTFVLLLMGIYVIVTFNPVPAAAVTPRVG